MGNSSTRKKKTKTKQTSKNKQVGARKGVKQTSGLERTRKSLLGHFEAAEYGFELYHHLGRLAARAIPRRPDTLALTQADGPPAGSASGC